MKFDLKTYAKKKHPYLLAFIIPTIIMLLIFATKHIFPFGDESFLNIDMYHQYFPFLTEFYHKLKNGESLFYSWNTGIGSNFLALYVYYLATPTNWLCLLVPEAYLMEFITYMVVIKIGLCGSTFAYYLHKHFKTDSYVVILFSTMYALSGYMAAYNWNVMWLDCIVLAPIIILGVERLVHDGDCKLYGLTLGLSILSNYYISIMICIFLVLYFGVLLIAKDPTDTADSKPLRLPYLCKIQNFYIKACVRFGIYSLLAGGMSAILLFPELAALKFTEFTSISFPSTVKTYFSVIDMLARHCFNVAIETGLDHWPNIYCGVAVLFLLPLYVMQKDIPLRQKASKLILLAFMLISFSTNLLNFIWHGLNYPDSLPARQSFLYIFLLLTVCYETILHIKKQSGKEMMAVFLGVLCFILLCEKLITDDAFDSACFLFTGIFLMCYAGFLYLYRTQSKVKSYWFIYLVALIAVESGLNTYLTSCSTVSRSTYLSNYDSYQILTERTIEETEDGDFFRFEKFARRTQNDAMLIGFPGGSYFSSTSNALVKDFYKKYGMKSSRVNYCYDGATPITAALLANRYMLYTIDRGKETLFTLSDTEGKLYLYKNNYTLPMGYMISKEMVSASDMDSITANHDAFINSESTTSTTITDPLVETEDIFDELFSSAEEVEENLHEDGNTSSSLNPIEQQNILVAKLGIDRSVFVPISLEQTNDKATITVETTGHLYAYTKNTKIDKIKMTYDGTSKTFKDIKKKYILDLGYHEAGTEISLSSENKADLNLSAYRIEEDVLSDFIEHMSSQTMIVDNYDETSITGHITVTEPGELVMSVPYEPGWTLLVDGKEASIDLFEDTFISVFLTEGSHTIELSYYPEGFNLGIIVTALSVALFATLTKLTSDFEKKKTKR